MSPAEVLAALLRAGIRVAVEGDRLRLRGRGLTPDLVQLARASKAALLELLTAPSSGGPLTHGRWWETPRYRGHNRVGEWSAHSGRRHGASLKRRDPDEVN